MLSVTIIPRNPSSAIKQESQFSKEKEDWDFLLVMWVFYYYYYLNLVYISRKTNSFTISSLCGAGLEYDTVNLLLSTSLTMPGQYLMY